MLQTAIIGAGLAVVGIVVTVLGAYRLGVARAARKWDASDGSRRPGRGVATVAVLIGLLLLAADAALLTTLVEVPGGSPTLRVVAAVVAALAALLLAMSGAAKLADRAELTALMRTPSRVRRQPEPATGQSADPAPREASADPAVPPTARPGWVYRDHAGAWFLVVAAGAGHRLVSLPDFKLVPNGTVTSPITVAGSVELAVWPLSETPEVREGEAQQTAT